VVGLLPLIHGHVCLGVAFSLFLMKQLYSVILSVPDYSGSHTSRRSAHESGEIVTPKHRPPLTPMYSFLLEAESTPGP
jgi:hypothetical protein